MQTILNPRAEISFDCYYPEDCNHIEGCYRLPDEDWKVFNFTRSWSQGQAGVQTEAVWRSGITGVEVRHPKDETLNQAVAKRILASVLGVAEWIEVAGPDSLQLK